MSAPVPEAVLQRIRDERLDDKTTQSGAISGSATTSEPLRSGPDQNDDTVEDNRRFKTLDVPMEAISADDAPLDDRSRAIRFDAEIGAAGELVIPRRYQGMLRTGQRVTVTVEANLEPDS